MLKSHPELVHLDEVCEHKTDRILKIAARAAWLLVCSVDIVLHTHRYCRQAKSLWSGQRDSVEEINLE